MERKSRTTNAEHGKQPGTDTGQVKPGKSGRRGKGSTGIPGTADGPPTERSEDFGRRRDIETADEPAEEHDRRHHDEDAEIGRPV